jgi:hypothetical protein
MSCVLHRSDEQAGPPFSSVAQLCRRGRRRRGTLLEDEILPRPQRRAAREVVKGSCSFILSSFFSRVAERLSSPGNTSLIKFHNIINKIIMKLNATYEE